MTDLSTQIEQAKPEQQREMLKLAWIRIHHGDGAADTPHNTEFLNTSECRRCDAFWNLLNIGTDEAFTGAALMLVPEGRVWTSGETGWAYLHSPDCNRVGGQWANNCSTPALAIAAACVRAHDAKEEG